MKCLCPLPSKVGFEAGKEGAYLSKLHPGLMNGLESRTRDCFEVLPKTAQLFFFFNFTDKTSNKSTI